LELRDEHKLVGFENGNLSWDSENILREQTVLN
jgi:hypothetical protein